MSNRTISGLLLAALLVFMLLLPFDIRVVGATVDRSIDIRSDTIYIRADGSIDPSTAPVLRDGDTYVFTDDICIPIRIEKSGVTVDGMGRAMHGSGHGTAIFLSGLVGVTVKNVRIESFANGIVLSGCSDCNVLENSVVAMSAAWGIALRGSSYVAVSRNNVTGTEGYGVFLYVSSSNSVYENDLRDNEWAGVGLWKSDGNIFYRNSMKNNHNDAMFFDTSKGNIVRGNNMSENNYVGVYLQVYGNNNFSWNTFVGNKAGGMVFEGSSKNNIYGNSFDNPSPQINFCPDCGFLSRNTWDKDYPSGGNCWSDYNGTDAYSGCYQNITGSDDVGDSSCILDGNNVDHYPLMNPRSPLVGDVNDDGRIDLQDMCVLAQAFGSSAGDRKWNALVDLDGNNMIDIWDLALLAHLL